MFGTVSLSARRTGAAGVVLAAVLAGAACSGSGTTSSPSGSGSGSTPPGSSSPSGSQTGSVTTGTVTPGPKNDLVKRKNVQLRGCTLSKTGGEASGVITNKGTKAVGYKISVVFTNDKASNVGEASRTVTAAAGKDTTWSVKGTFANPPKKILCVVVAVE